MKKFLLIILFLCASLSKICAQESTAFQNQVSPQLISGTKIVVADAYYVSLEGTGNDRSTRYNLDSVPYSVGWKSAISYHSSSPFDPTLYPNFPNFSLSLYGFQVYVHFDESQNRIWFKTGSCLAAKETSHTFFSDTIEHRVINYLYAIPEQWLNHLNDTATYVISGYLNDDGSLFIDGGIAFFIDYQCIDVNLRTGEKEIYYLSSCMLSPVYRNIRFFNPNGIHEYMQITDKYDLNSNLENHMIDYVKVMEGGEASGTEHGYGNGGRVVRPIDPRPIRSRLIGHVEPHVITLSSDGFICESESVIQDNKYGDFFSVSDVVYMIQVNDSTLHVYNLYGKISEVNVLYLKKTGEMSLRVQPYDQSTDHSIYCFSRFGGVFNQDGEFVPGGITGTATKDQISWGVTIPVDYQGLKNYYFFDNSLRFIDGSAFYIPGSAVRGDVNMDGDISIKDVTALISMLLSSESDAPILGKAAYDCNQDDMITIADVTFLISYLLSGTW